jgi:mRNA-degrading endonuclease YafQ of YafQ-DinJ toxin-antitoxin module
MYKGLDSSLKEEVKEKIELFRNEKNHVRLKTYKLKGSLKNTYAFTVNYQIRIVFEFEGKKRANLLYVGSHDELYR